MKLIIDIIGWIGSIEILVAYGLNSYQKIRSDSPLFYFLNLTGGVLLTVYTIYKGAFASTFINVVWVIIAAIAIMKMIRKKNQPK
jgi:lipid-A-disaccharide synthase-like uncharacterized protein